MRKCRVTASFPNGARWRGGKSRGATARTRTGATPFSLWRNSQPGGVRFRHDDVFFRPRPQGRLLLVGQRAHDLGRRAIDHGARRAGETLGHQRIRSDDAARANAGSVQDGGAHADEAFVLDGAGVDDGGMADGAPGSDVRAELIREVHDRIVLDVGPVAHPDFVDVAAQHGAVEHAARRSEDNIAVHRGVGRDKKRARHLGRFPQMPLKAALIGHDLPYFSFSYGTPMAFGATASPTNPASSSTVRIYGRARMNWTGTTPTSGSAVPWRREASASVKAKSRHAPSVGHGRHLPKISAARAR